jgi:PAS domain S-box-containing protein
MDKYTELYDFTPLGYFTLTKAGKIIELNLCGSQMLGKERAKLINSQFGFFVSTGTSIIFNNFLEKIFISKTREYCEITLVVNEYPPIFVHITGIVSSNSVQCRVIIADISRLKKMEYEKAKEHLENDALINSSSDLLWCVSDDFKLISANKTFINSLKENGGFLIKPGDNILPSEYFPDEYLKYWKDLYSKGLAGEKVLTEICTPRAGSPDLFWYELKVDPVYTGNKVTGVACSMRDNTKRKKTEEEIRRTNERFELIGKATNDALWDWNLETNKGWGNEIHQQLYGLTIEDPVPDNEEWKRRIHPEDRERIVELLNKALASEHGSFIEEYRFYTENKGWINIYGRTLIERDKDDKPVRLVGSMMDITETKKAAEKLIESEEKYRTLVQEAADGIFLVDQEGNYLEANQSAALLTGYSADELKKMNAVEIVSEEDLKRNPLKIEEIKKGSTVFLERIIIKKDGTPVHVDISSKLMDNGKVIAILRDTTQRKAAEEKLKRFAAGLQASNTELERFAYIASHDLQEPLRMISSFVDLLEEELDGQLKETTREYIHFIKDGSGRMKTLINDLLLYSKVGSSKEKFSTVDLNEVMKYTTLVLEEDIIINKAQLIISPMPVITADKTLISQLFVNLFSNALKYHGEEKPVIEAGYNEEPDKYIFYVKDNGIGINPEFFEKIFIIFQRLHNKNEYSGTGIGLAICKKIAEIHNGNIWVESQEKKGSTFYFSLPKK